MSAVVVNYKACGPLLACVDSLRDEGVGQVVVVDNASGDGAEAALAAADPAAVFVATGSNLGYGGAANRGAAVATGSMLLVCNPDLVVGRGCVAALVAALDADQRLALVGPRIDDPDGGLYPSPRRFPGVGVALGHAFLGLVAPRNRFTRAYRMLDWDHDRAGPADWVSGSCFLARRTAWDALGGFDESYFMYAEDVDLCWRAWKSGWSVGFEPAGRVVHTKGASTDLAPYRMIVQHHRSLLRFFARTSRPAERPLLPLVTAGLVVRAALACAQRGLSAWRAR
ncbi:MAG: glycosyltransferase family 2 protein [Acidimicrobiales bacterium]